MRRVAADITFFLGGFALVAALVVLGGLIFGWPTRFGRLR